MPVDVDNDTELHDTVQVGVIIENLLAWAYHRPCRSPGGTTAVRSQQVACHAVMTSRM